MVVPEEVGCGEWPEIPVYPIEISVAASLALEGGLRGFASGVRALTERPRKKRRKPRSGGKPSAYVPPPVALDVPDAPCPLPLPVIVKPRTFSDYGVLGHKNLLLRDDLEWKNFLARFRGSLDHFIAQCVIGGEDTNLWVCNATADKQHRIVSAAGMA